jgi:hypothetical protein
LSYRQKVQQLANIFLGKVDGGKLLPEPTKGAVVGPLRRLGSKMKMRAAGCIESIIFCQMSYKTSKWCFIWHLTSGSSREKTSSRSARVSNLPLGKLIFLQTNKSAELKESMKNSGRLIIKTHTPTAEKQDEAIEAPQVIADHGPPPQNHYAFS